MKDSFWGLGEKTPNRKHLKKGDKVVFYIGGREGGHFAGNCTLSSDSYMLSSEKKETVSHGMSFYRADYGVDLAGIEIWDEPHELDSELVNKLGFISNKEMYWAHFQGGVIAISEDDFNIILNPARKALQEEIENPAEFQLEKYLQEFIVENFDRIRFDPELRVYKEEGRDGSQFPTTVGYIDILCTEKNSGAFVVVELKKGMTSDKVIGQTLRYIGWVRENLARGKPVKGLIIAGEVDDKLRYSLPRDPEIRVTTYELDFKLHDA